MFRELGIQKNKGKYKIQETKKIDYVFLSKKSLKTVQRSTFVSSNFLRSFLAEM